MPVCSLKGAFGPGVHQLLQAVWLAEKFVGAALARGGAPRVVFFRANAALWRACPGARLLRALVIRHLRDRSIPTLTHFDDWGCGAWLDFIRDLRPAFIVAEEDDREDREDGVPAPAAPGGPLSEARVLLRSQLACCLASGICVVYIRGVRFEEHRMFGFFVRAGTKGLAIEDFVTPVRVYLATFPPHVPGPLSAGGGRWGGSLAGAAQARAAATAATGGSELSRRALLPAAVAAVLVSAMTESDGTTSATDPPRPAPSRLALPAAVDLSKLVCIHAALLACLPLRERALQLGGTPTPKDWNPLLSCQGAAPLPEEEPASSFSLDDLRVYLARLEDSLATLVDDGDPGPAEDLDVDLLDGRLLVFLAAQPFEDVADLGEGVAALADASWAAVCDLSGRAWCPLLPVMGPGRRSRSGLDDAAVTAVSSSGGEIAPFGGAADAPSLHSNSFLCAFFGADAGNTLRAIQADAPVLGFEKPSWVSVQFRQDFHWHTGEPIESDVWTSTEDKAAHQIRLYKAMSMGELNQSDCRLLSRGYRTKLYKTLADMRHLKSVSDRAAVMRNLEQVIRKKLELSFQYMAQMAARHLESYADSLTGTRFNVGAARSAPPARRGHSAGGSGAPAGVPGPPAVAKKESKADKIIRENMARTAAKDAERLGQQWAALRETLTSDRGWGAISVSLVDGFLAGAGLAPAALEAAEYRMLRFMSRWEADVRARGRGLDPLGAAGPGFAVAPTPSVALILGTDEVLADAVQVWESAHLVVEQLAALALQSGGGVASCSWWWARRAAAASSTASCR